MLVRDTARAPRLTRFCCLLLHIATLTMNPSNIRVSSGMLTPNVSSSRFMPLSCSLSTFLGSQRRGESLKRTY